MNSGVVYYQHSTNARTSGAARLVFLSLFAGISAYFITRGLVVAFKEPASASRLLYLIGLSFLAGIFGLLLLLLGLFSLRDFLGGGFWSCLLRGDCLEIAHPSRGYGKNFSIPVAEIQQFIFEIKSNNFKYYIVANGEEFAVQDNALGDFLKFLAALLGRNPEIEVVKRSDGSVKLMGFRECALDELCVAAKSRRQVNLK